MALLGIVWIKTSMCLLMPRQVWTCCVILTTFRASVTRLWLFRYSRYNGNGRFWRDWGRWISSGGGWGETSVLLAAPAIGSKKGFIGVSSGFTIVHGKSTSTWLSRGGCSWQCWWQEWGRSSLTSIWCSRQWIWDHRFDIRRCGGGWVLSGSLTEVQDGMSCIDIFNVAIFERCWWIIRMKGWVYAWRNRWRHCRGADWWVSNGLTFDLDSIFKAIRSEFCT